MALGFFVTPLCSWFAVQLAVDIALVHFPEGWFVVGAGRNGMEYSVLLIIACVVIALLHRPDPLREVADDQTKKADTGSCPTVSQPGSTPRSNRSASLKMLL